MFAGGREEVHWKQMGQTFELQLSEAFYEDLHLNILV